MTTMTFDFASSSSFVKLRAPRKSFAARLAALQAKQEHGASLADAAAVVGRGALASVPFAMLAWMFVAV